MIVCGRNLDAAEPMFSFIVSYDAPENITGVSSMSGKNLLQIEIHPLQFEDDEVRIVGGVVDCLGVIAVFR